MDWLDLLAIQGTVKSPQHHSSKASILRRSAFFTVQLSQPYVNTGKTIALTIWTFVGRVMSLLLNTLSWFSIAFLPISNGGGNGKPPRHTCRENLMNWRKGYTLLPGPKKSSAQILMWRQFLQILIVAPSYISPWYVSKKLDQVNKCLKRKQATFPLSYPYISPLTVSKTLFGNSLI